MQLSDFGWCAFFEEQYQQYQDQDYFAMRITRVDKDKYVACNHIGEYSCEITGKFRFDTNDKGNFPTVGDWVVASLIHGEQKAMIHALLPRKSIFSRNVAGQVTEEQIIAANIDTVFIVIGLDLNFNLRRIERYLSIAWESGAMPVILLNKADLCTEPELWLDEVKSIAMGIDIYLLSASEQQGLESLDTYLQPGQTIAFLGSSGVGKSTIINSILGTNRLKVNEVSELGSRGRHTTTHRELIVLPEGGMVIDTPGMRELQVWGDEEGLKQAFDDIEELSLNCRFRDCSHVNEPGCAVKEAIANGPLEPKRFESYLKLKREFAYLSDRQIMKANALEKSRWKSISQVIKEIKKDKH